MSNNGPFGFDADDFDRKAREVGEGIRDALGRLGNIFGDMGVGTVWSSGSGPDDVTVNRPRRPTTGETGNGVWAVFVVDDEGTASVEQVFATELDALRANKSNTDPHRRVRFLPYGIAVGALDDDHDTGTGPTDGADDYTEPDPEH
ncbi:hypothetical protein ACFYVR_10580 [Rhodococcus sp. NPDC003318]|uniref:hypothetical protein n=1 Tax=Rhodococcus sp. NPDC003318 TaxID=3364503 RepID=UPI0036A68ADB